VGVTETFTLTDTMPLPLGAANVAVGSIVGKDGELQTRLFVTSFDARFVSIVDPLLRRVESSVRTGRGPLYVTFDVDPVAKQSHLYVSEFTDSYVSVIDLDSRRLTYGTALLNIGPPKAPREEQ
jgi:DNA-binding beta-propeller fold protein YncE